MRRRPAAGGGGRHSAGTFAETLIVAGRRRFGPALAVILDALPLTVLRVDEAAARRIGDIHARWGSGAGTAGLNMGDCYAYEAATRLGAPLLFVGDDFRRTDVRPAI